MTEHHISVTVKTPVHQVYELFTHFNNFPKFMRFFKEGTYYDAQRSHWVAQIADRHEWDAFLLTVTHSDASSRSCPS